MNILLFGGTFDPPHYGHISLLQSAIDTVCPDKALIIPAAIPPHKANASADKAQRLMLCEAILPYIHGTAVAIEPCELMRAGPSYTIDTVNILQGAYPSARLYFCLGSDMLLYFRKWRSYSELLRKLVLVVQMRIDDESTAVINMAKSLTAESGSIIFTHTQPVIVSSTEVRDSLVAGKAIQKLVPLQVARLIQKHHLYTKENENT